MIENIAMINFILGITVCVINGHFRKIETDFLLTLSWFLFWWLTPIYLSVKLAENIKDKQPMRRAKIYLLRKF